MVSPLSGKAVIGQSGGPTSVINQSLVGAIEACCRSDLVTDVYGALHGVDAEGLLVASASSLREPLADLARRYGVHDPEANVQLSFGASSLLAAQLRAGAPIDVLVSADERILDRLEAEELLVAEDRITLARNRLVVT